MPIDATLSVPTPPLHAESDAPPLSVSLPVIRDVVTSNVASEAPDTLTSKVVHVAVPPLSTRSLLLLSVAEGSTPVDVAPDTVRCDEADSEIPPSQENDAPPDAIVSVDASSTAFQDAMVVVTVAVERVIWNSGAVMLVDASLHVLSVSVMPPLDSSDEHALLSELPDAASIDAALKDPAPALHTLSEAPPVSAIAPLVTLVAFRVTEDDDVPAVTVLAVHAAVLLLASENALAPLTVRAGNVPVLVAPDSVTFELLLSVTPPVQVNDVLPHAKVSEDADSVAGARHCRPQGWPAIASG